MPSSQDRFSLRIAHIAFHLFKTLKTDGRVNTDLMHERGTHDDLLRDFTLSEWNEAMEELLHFEPKPLAQGAGPGTGWFAITDYGKERTSADVLSELVQPQYRASNRPVEIASKWQFRIDITKWAFVGSLVLFFAAQSIYLSSGSLLPTFEPWLAKLATVIALASLAMAGAFSEQRDKYRHSNEQFVASAFYDAYVWYKNFVKASDDVNSLKQGQKMVRKAAARMQQTGKPRWEILAEDLDRISEIGKNVDSLLLPAMPNHAGSFDVEELLIVLARCFLERTRNSTIMAQRLLAKANISPPQSLPLGHWNRLSSFGSAHPSIAGCVGGG